MASLGDLNDRIFRELDRLEELDMSDKDMREAEIDRAHAIEGLASVTISNARTVIDAIRLQRDAEIGIAGAVAVPKMLTGD